MHPATCRILSFAILAGTYLLAWESAAGQEADDFLRCAREPDEVRRLACFDRAAADQGADAPAEPPAPAEATPPRERSRPVPAASAPGGTVAAPAADPSLSPIVSTAPAADVAPEAVGPPREDSGEYTAVVTRIARQPRGEHVVALDNGEVWQEIVKNSYFPVEPGDAVSIQARRLGGYRLITSSGQAIAVRQIR